MKHTCRLFAMVLLIFSFANHSELEWAQSSQGTGSVSSVAIGPQYDTIHVYVKLLFLVTDGHLPYPYGRETTGYEVDDLVATLEKASSLGVMVLVPPLNADGRMSAIVQFPEAISLRFTRPFRQRTI